MFIAISGCIGSGKSTILKKIQQLYQFPIFSADDLVLKAYQDKEVLKQLDQAFHCVVNGVVDKKIIKSQLNEQNIQILNQIIHPYVKKEILKIKAFNDIAIVEVPLLFEANMEDLFDYSIVISVNEQLRHQKLKERDVKNYANMLLLEKGQMSNQQKIKKASFVISSQYDELENEKQIREIFKQILIR